jgi:phosphoglycolate phosphatase
MLTGVRGVLFDKDGTLFDFTASWSAWAAGVLGDLSAGDAGHAQAMAQAIRFDLGAGQFLSDSPVIAGTMDEPVRLLAPFLPDWTVEQLKSHLFRSAARAEMVPPIALAPLMRALRARDLVLGVATNDAESIARDHLTQAGILDQFVHVLGYDSGFTPKPAPDMLLGFARFVALDVGAVVMVGDSTHDLIAGRAAGMQTVGVLTGMADKAELAPYADLVLPDIGHLMQVLV